MRMHVNRRKETWKQARRRLIAEASQFLCERLERPELAVAIPAIPAGAGRFPKSMTGAFRRRVLFE